MPQKCHEHPSSGHVPPQSHGTAEREASQLARPELLRQAARDVGRGHSVEYEAVLVRESDGHINFDVDCYNPIRLRRKLVRHRHVLLVGLVACLIVVIPLALAACLICCSRRLSWRRCLHLGFFAPAWRLVRATSAELSKAILDLLRQLAMRRTYASHPASTR